MLLEFKNIDKRFPGFSLKDVSFSVKENDYFILLGESGAGKSLILETLAGLVEPGSGSIIFNGHDITRVRIQDRQIGIVFQDHAIFPHLSVYENIAYPLKCRKFNRHQIHERITDIASQIGILAILQRKPGSLSGGELQRVALARSLVQQPAILLLDEPLASLDIRLKSDIRALLRDIHRRGQTIIHVTHDYEEALALGTRIAVVDRGRIIQEGTLEEVFHFPKTRFVANFIGIRNFFKASVAFHNEMFTATTTEGVSFALSGVETDGDGYIIIRGEDIIVSRDQVESSAVNMKAGRVIEILNTPRGMEVSVDIGIVIYALITATSVTKLSLTEGAPVWIHIKATAVRFIVA